MSRLICNMLIAALLTAPAVSCQRGEEAPSVPLLAQETFDWCEQPISFQPPPEPWRRSRYQQGGRSGIDFVHSKSVGERIAITEYYQVGDRNRREGGVHRYRLEDFVEQARARPEDWSEPDTIRVAPVCPDTLASGQIVQRLDYSIFIKSRWYIAREYYLLENNCMFVAQFLGLEESLPLFERVVESITFPGPHAVPLGAEARL
jgi:hypothetical protein